eukprot:1500102-Lingulodinium_polyedra.AAC.1
MMQTKWPNRLEGVRRNGLRTASPGPVLEDPAVVAWAAVAGPRQPRPDRCKSRGRMERTRT